jgi:CheY-like chemotaxis protein
MRRTDSESIKGRIVLIVEDELFLRYALADTLRDAGCVVVEAASTDQAISLAREGPQIDALITDIQLHGQSSGWEIAEAFRAKSKNTPVIYTSGNADDRTRCVPDSLFFDKPYRPAEVLQACQRLMASNGSSS